MSPAPRRLILVDTGPLVAFLNRRDHYHAWASEVLDDLEPPLYTCDAVLSEACFLLRHVPGGPQAAMTLLERDLLWVMLDLQGEAIPVTRLMTRYADLPTSLADVCLVRMAELHPQASVLTLDSDFHVYRKNRRLKIPLVTPPALHERARSLRRADG